MTIAIDPDVTLNGVAVIDERDATITTRALDFYDTIEMLRDCRKDDTEVFIEAGWLNAAHWHVSPRDTKQAAAAKGNAAGRNHEVGRKLCEICARLGLRHTPVRPLRKMWSGKEGKITSAELRRVIATARLTLTPIRDNQETRDAALIAITNARATTRKT